MGGIKEITTDTLRTWLETGKDFSILDIGRIHERGEGLSAITKMLRFCN